MLRDKAFRIALILSISVHSALFISWGRLNLPPHELKKLPEKSIEVNYLKIQIRPEPKIEKIVSQVSVEKNAPKLKAEQKEEPKIETKEALPAPEAKLVKLEQVEKPRVKIGPQKPEAKYADYYTLVREKLKSTLLRMYRSRADQGKVYIEFTLRSNGVLGQANILDEKSTSSSKLNALTLKALRESSPFPPFPPELSESEINFNVVVSFRKQ